MKYHNKFTLVGSIKFQSAKEAERYIILSDLQKKGYIDNLVLQKKFELIPKQKAERPVYYYADFVYDDLRTGKTIVEDVKGMRTDVYKIKKKLMKFIHNIDITEI